MKRQAFRRCSTIYIEKNLAFKNPLHAHYSISENTVEYFALSRDSKFYSGWQLKVNMLHRIKNLFEEHSSDDFIYDLSAEIKVQKKKNFFSFLLQRAMKKEV